MTTRGVRNHHDSVRLAENDPVTGAVRISNTARRRDKARGGGGKGGLA